MASKPIPDDLDFPLQPEELAFIRALARADAEADIARRLGKGNENARRKAA